MALFAQLNQAGIRWGIFAGCAVSLLTGNRQATDVDILVHNDDFDRAAQILPVTERTDKKVTTITTEQGETLQSEADVLAVIVKNADLEFVANHVFIAPEGRFPIFLTNLAVENRLLFEVAGHRVYLANPFDTLIFKAFMRRGPEQNKFDAKDVADLVRAMPIDQQYAAARIKETGATPQALNFLEQAGLKM
ncbi:MAG TPA: nucleotidyltransferase family protein [Candidatus Saccharimonadales bacterium]|nr:nucleotidyltransferase family protein [Candidatus Saccharimonadales bacterium]